MSFVSLSELQQGIRQLQLHNRKSDEKSPGIEKFYFLSLCYTSRKYAFKKKTKTSGYFMTKETCRFACIETWFIHAI
jgi:hypothetical protein